MVEKRVVFDFEIRFTTGGGVQGQDFRLDMKGESISDQELEAYIIADMHLLMVGQVTISNKFYVGEPHKRKNNPVVNPRHFIDLSHEIFDGLITYKGLPAPTICDFLSREESRSIYHEGTTFQIGKIEMVTNTGTYMDCPFHRFEQGKDLSELDLAQLADLDAVCIHATNAAVIGKEFFMGKELRNKAVVVFTNWARHWNTEAYFENHPFLTEEAAAYLKECKVKLVGIDSHNIDDNRGGTRPVHTTLLGSGILIVEHLCNLDKLPESGFTFTAAPPKFKGAGTFPVRAYARL